MAPAETRAPEETLRRLEERLEQASAAAERLFSEASAAARERVPPQGWQARRPADGPSDLELVLTALGAVRELIPAELRRRLADAVRELLLAVRALIDWYLERLERRRGEPVVVQDIPIA